MAKPAKIIVRRKKFIEVDIPLINKKIELVGNDIEDLKGRTIKLDLTRQLRGKSIEATLQVVIDEEKPTTKSKKMVLMPYFIKRMLRKRTSYVEDSIITPTQESLVNIKPFLITRKKVSRAVRKTLRNLTKNWIEDYLAEKTDEELFDDILTNRLQKPLSLKLKKTYPLSLCEIRVLEIMRPLKPEEIPKKSKKVEKEIKETIDQVAELEQEKLKKAEKKIKETQEKAAEKESKDSEKTPKKEKAEKKTETKKKEDKTVKKKTETKKDKTKEKSKKEKKK